MRLLFFLLFPALELYLLVRVGSVTGALNMVLWVFLSAAIGVWAVRTQGQTALRNAQAQMAEGRVPQNNFLEGVLLFFGGLLLILPGLITDAAGLLLLVPDIRRFVAARLGLSMAEQRAEHPGQWGGASRIIYYSSSFPGDFSRRFGGAPQGGRSFGGFARHEETPGAEQGPRQATIIESTAIDITDRQSGRDDDDRANGPDGPDGPDAAGRK